MELDHKLDIYLMPRQYGKTQRIIENFILDCFRNKDTTNISVIIAHNRQSAKHIEHRIKEYFAERPTDTFDSEAISQLLKYVLVPHTLNKLYAQKKIAKCYVDEYCFFDDNQKSLFKKFVCNDINDIHRICIDTQIYSSLTNFVLSSKSTEMHQLEPDNLLYHPKANTLVISSLYDKHENYLSERDYIFEYDLKNGIL